MRVARLVWAVRDRAMISAVQGWVGGGGRGAGVQGTRRCPERPYTCRMCTVAELRPSALRHMRHTANDGNAFHTVEVPNMSFTLPTASFCAGSGRPLDIDMLTHWPPPPRPPPPPPPPPQLRRRVRRPRAAAGAAAVLPAGPHVGGAGRGGVGRHAIRLRAACCLGLTRVPASHARRGSALAQQGVGAQAAHVAGRCRRPGPDAPMFASTHPLPPDPLPPSPPAARPTPTRAAAQLPRPRPPTRSVLPPPPPPPRTTWSWRRCR